MNKLAIATAAAGFALNSVHSAPLPEAAADEVGVSQQRLGGARIAVPVNCTNSIRQSG
ncbi:MULTISPECIES: hypothetical protein [Bradyrhizobium]|uniref:hypothetical protein n=1 Tax=Bradyrhizobium TaxID=374 RepID=UPI001CD4E58C|nr:MULTISPECIES: hypothetical protein [Bradyrhizobium]MCA1411161.1 hypothetical protein [Bradyrhizobium sp. NBAIM20]MCA1464005.1 hypothetical protein [Bradyrhizobium sp. NBAIM18]MCA1530039.1 hypothetical protein [Bradyrhizobium yuanmingense]